MAWFSRVKSGADESTEGEKRIRTEGLWLKCDGCGQIIWKKTLDENFQTCPQCGHHFRVDARARLALLFDDGVYQELDAGLTSTDPLQFSDSKTYAARLAEMQEATSLSDALISGWGALAGRHVNVCAMELKFVGGSMGTVVGEKITRAVERSIERRSPLIVVSASGGTGAITYSITPNIGTQSPAGTFTGLTAGAYTIKATDVNNCSASTNQLVRQPAAAVSFKTSRRAILFIERVIPATPCGRPNEADRFCLVNQRSGSGSV